MITTATAVITQARFTSGAGELTENIITNMEVRADDHVDLSLDRPLETAR